MDFNVEGLRQQFEDIRSGWSIGAYEKDQWNDMFQTIKWISCDGQHILYMCNILAQEAFQNTISQRRIWMIFLAPKRMLQWCMIILNCTLRCQSDKMTSTFRTVRTVMQVFDKHWWHFVPYGSIMEGPKLEKMKISCVVKISWCVWRRCWTKNWRIWKSYNHQGIDKIVRLDMTHMHGWWWSFSLRYTNWEGYG